MYDLTAGICNRRPPKILASEPLAKKRQDKALCLSGIGQERSGSSRPAASHWPSQGGENAAGGSKKLPGLRPPLPFVPVSGKTLGDFPQKLTLSMLCYCYCYYYIEPLGHRYFPDMKRDLRGNQNVGSMRRAQYVIQNM